MPDAQAAEVIARFLERHRVAVFALFTVFFFVPAAIRAETKPFWHDEIYTVLLAGLPSIANQWAAVRDGADLAPPLNALATRGVEALTGVGPVVTRIPAMVGFWTMTLVVFVMVRRRANASVALAAACIPLFTAAYRYWYEARPYGLMMGLASLAWWAWAEAASGHRRNRCLAILGLSLAAGLWNHYYAVLVYAPILSGEAVRTIRSRHVDPGVSIAVAGSLLAAVPLLPLIRVSSAQAPNFWARPTTADILATYRFLFDSLSAIEFRWTIAAIVVLLTIARFRPMQERPVSRRLPAHEIAAGITCLVLPVLAVLLGVLVTGGLRAPLCSARRRRRKHGDPVGAGSCWLARTGERTGAAGGPDRHVSRNAAFASIRRTLRKPCGRQAAAVERSQDARPDRRLGTAVVPAALVPRAPRTEVQVGLPRGSGLRASLPRLGRVRSRLPRARTLDRRHRRTVRVVHPEPSDVQGLRLGVRLAAGPAAR